MAYVVVDQVFDLDIPHTPKAVLFSLARAVNHERYEESGDTRCWPSQATIAREIGVTPRTVRSAVKYLEDHQIAVPYAWGKGGPGVATRYRLYFDHVPRIKKPIRNVDDSSTLTWTILHPTRKKLPTNQERNREGLTKKQKPRMRRRRLRLPHLHALNTPESATHGSTHSTAI
jgi:cell wall-associated NlpC family hydrolase